MRINSGKFTTSIIKNTMKTKTLGKPSLNRIGIDNPESFIVSAYYGSGTFLTENAKELIERYNEGTGQTALLYDVLRWHLKDVSGNDYTATLFEKDKSYNVNLNIWTKAELNESLE